MNAREPTVTSRDGTRLGVSVLGAGPGVVLVDGAFCHRSFGPTPQLAPLLAQHFTVVHHDRRGRGTTGKGNSAWSIEREIEDIDALVEVARRESGHDDVCLYGTSSGAMLAARAVAAGVRVRKLAMHEPPLSLDGTHYPQPADYIAQIDAMLKNNDPLGASKLFLRVVGVPAFAAFMMMLVPPVRRNMKTCGPTLPHDFAILGDTQRGGPLPVDIAEMLGRIAVPTLTIVGGKSPAYMHHAVKRVSELVQQPVPTVVVPGQDHNIAAKAVGPVLSSFFAPA